MRKFKSNDLVVLKRDALIRKVEDYLPRLDYVKDDDRLSIRQHSDKKIARPVYRSTTVKYDKCIPAGTIATVVGYEFIPIKRHSVNHNELTRYHIVIFKLRDKFICYDIRDVCLKVLMLNSFVYFQNSGTFSLASEKRSDMEVEISFKLKLQDVDETHAQKIVNKILDNIRNNRTIRSLDQHSFKVTGIDMTEIIKMQDGKHDEEKEI